MSDESTRLDILKVLGAVALQGGLFVWWIASANATITLRVDNDERRIAAIEQFDQQMSLSQSAISDRLARVEEKTQDELETSRRIEAMVQGMVRRGK